MGKLKLLNEANPSALSGYGRLVSNSTTKRLTLVDDAGKAETIGGITNHSTANQTPFATNTYLAGSSIAIPPALVRIGTTYRLRFDMAKTAAGTAALAVNVRFGTAGTTADTARLTFTFGAGTAAVDMGWFELLAHFRAVGASAVLVGILRCEHHLAATGLVSTGAAGGGILTVTSAAFDATVANSIIGVSVNGGSSFSGTNTVVQAMLDDC